MKNFWERIRDMYLNPAVGVPAVIREGIFPEAFRIVAVSVVVSIVVSYIESVHTPEPMTIGMGLALIFFSMLMWPVDAGICYVVAKALGGRGEFRTLLTTNGYASYMGIVVGVITMFLFLIGAPELMGNIINVVFFVWMLWINVIIVREVMRVSTTKALVISLIPVAIIAVLVLMLITAYIAGGGQIPG